MFRSILVPLDGSPFGEHALPLALAAARRTGAALHLVHVHVPSAAWRAAELVSGIVPGGASEVVVEKERAYVGALVDRLKERVDAVDARVLQGPVARTLAEQVRDVGVDLVVMATHGRTGVNRLWHRGVAEHLTRDLAVPILLVRAGDEPVALDEAPPLRHVLVPLAGDAYSEEVLLHATALGRAFGARYTLLRAVQRPYIPGYSLIGPEEHVDEFELERRERRAVEYLDGVAARLRARGLEVETRVAASEDAARTILSFAGCRPDGSRDERSDVGLVAMETHGLGAVSHLVAGSVVETVLRETPVPLLLHHALPRPEPAGAAAAGAREAAR